MTSEKRFLTDSSNIIDAISSNSSSFSNIEERFVRTLRLQINDLTNFRKHLSKDKMSLNSCYILNIALGIPFSSLKIGFQHRINEKFVAIEFAKTCLIVFYP